MKGLLPLVFPFLFAPSLAQEAPSPIAAERAADSSAWAGTGAALDLPVRRFSDRAALLPRLHGSASSDTLFARGVPFRSFFLDGHATSLALPLPQTAVSGVRAYVGDVPARYGDVLGAALVVDTAHPDLQRWTFAAEALRTAAGGEANAGRLALSVPLLSGRLAFRLDAEGETDAAVDRTGLRTITPETRARIAAAPTVLVGTLGGEPVTVGLPTGIPNGTPIGAILADPANFGVDLPSGFVLNRTPVVPANLLLTEDDFVGVDRLGEHREGQVYGAVRARPIETLTLDLAGQWGETGRDVISPFLTPLNPGLLPRETLELRRVFGTARYQAGRLDVQADVSASAGSRLIHPAGFSDDVRDAIRYGLPREAGTFYRISFDFPGEDATLAALPSPSRPQDVRGLANVVGFGGGLYDRAESRRSRAALRSRLQIGRFGIEHVGAGVEWKAAIHRRYRLDASGLARRARSRDVERYEEFEPYDVFPSVYYGYDGLGLEEASVSDATQEAVYASGRRAPYRPRYAALRRGVRRSRRGLGAPAGARWTSRGPRYGRWARGRFPGSGAGVRRGDAS